MRRNLSSLLLTVGLVGLLILLGALQRRWQSQISESSREKMRRQLGEESERFISDFNREMQNAYFNFQMNADDWRTADYRPFIERYEYWRDKTQYPELIDDFYFFSAKGDEAPLKFNSDAHTFGRVGWTAELRDLRARFADDNKFQPVYEDIYTLVLPVHEEPKRLEHILIRRVGIPDAKVETRMPKSEPEKFGFLAIKLNPAIIQNKIFPDLAAKYFSDGDYNLSVIDRSGKSIFQMGLDQTSSDISAGFFDVAPRDMIFFEKKELLSSLEPREDEKKVIGERYESRTTLSRVETRGNSSVKVEVQRGERPRATTLATGNGENEIKPWTFSAQHTAGSIDTYIANTKFRNLGIGFGILALLGLAVAAIIFSAQRAKMLAQRQVDFVSSVSHEFRTPLAVIYSAGENLADGIASDENQVSRYGDLIKAEGKKLSSMVEQILEFAGANSGRRKYNFTETEICDVVQDALDECSPLIKEKNIAVEKNMSLSLATVSADRGALSQAIQNLIINSVKYSNGNAWLRISAENGDGHVRISVEDRGIGVAKSELRQIFGPFYRSKVVVDAQIHGNGLGLSLVKQVVEAHGGAVTAESEIGKGSRFTIELPLVVD